MSVEEAAELVGVTGYAWFRRFQRLLIRFPNLEEDLLNKRKEGRTHAKEKGFPYEEGKVRELIRIWNHMSWQGEKSFGIKDYRKPDKR